MVAYSFKKRFSPLIADGTKTGTIRAERKRHARVGEPIQLYEAMRTKYCRKIISDPQCISVQTITLAVLTDSIGFIVLNDQTHVCPDEFDLFARADGFLDIRDMHQFWLKEHGLGVFEGVWVQWSFLYQSQTTGRSG